jgi:hypothetical protein
MAKPITRSGHVPDQEKPIHDDKERAAPIGATPSTIVDGKEVSTSHRINSCCIRDRGGARRDRTDDLKLAKLALSQLSYGPNIGKAGKPQRHRGTEKNKEKKPF